MPILASKDRNCSFLSLTKGDPMPFLLVMSLRKKSPRLGIFPMKKKLFLVPPIQFFFRYMANLCFCVGVDIQLFRGLKFNSFWEGGKIFSRFWLLPDGLSSALPYPFLLSLHAFTLEIPLEGAVAPPSRR